MAAEVSPETTTTTAPEADTAKPKRARRAPAKKTTPATEPPATPEPEAKAAKPKPAPARRTRKASEPAPAEPTPEPTPAPEPTPEPEIKAPAKRTRKAPAKAVEPSPEPEPTPSPSPIAATKAKRFAEFLAEFNKGKQQADRWTVAYKNLSTSPQPMTELVAEHAKTGQTIVLRWDRESEVYNYYESVYTRTIGNSGEWTIRNVSEARMIVTGKVTKGSATGRRAGRPRTAAPATAGGEPSAPRRRTRNADDDVPRRNVPFNLDDPDDVILATLTGKTITWRRGAISYKKVVHNNKHLRLEVSPRTSQKMLHFADDQFYTVYLEKILTVS